ncbi:cytochrome P450 [Lasiosphaeria hispida]|uniref:Cytochrome P450 n=1 Tax=Lasiosphaeria hispida TaxID=260671 RepID=A0AAJ0MD40_9PEZI|nr:cytochrome P450 [Lasiosphaeria hispida]
MHPETRSDGLTSQYILTGLLNPLSPIPGPWYTRFSSLPSKYHRLRGTKILWVDALHRRYGPIVRVDAAQVAIAEPAFWDAVGRVGAGFRKTQFHERMRIGPEHFLFSMTDAKAHAARRRLFARALTADALRRNWEARIRGRVEVAVGRIKQQMEAGDADLVVWWRLMAGDVIALLSFGESFDLLEGAGRGDEYFAALQNAGINIVLRDLVPFGILDGIAKVLPWKRLRDVVDANRVIADKGTLAVRNLRATGLDRPNLFSNMLAEAEKAHEGEKGEDLGLTDDAIRSEVAGFLLAGSDTTSMALTYAVWAILRHPDLQRRLERELARLDPAFTDKDLEGLPLLNNVLDEALRLYSPGAPGILRLPPPEGITWRGYHIPGDTQVLAQQWTLVRDDEMFPDPERFDETRFEKPAEGMRRLAQPWGVGTRSCIGNRLAVMEMRLAVALFFRECRGARLGEGVTDDSMAPLFRFFMFPKGHTCKVTLRQ